MVPRVKHRSTLSIILSPELSIDLEISHINITMKNDFHNFAIRQYLHNHQGNSDFNIVLLSKIFYNNS